MANRYDIIHIDFQANARGANAAIESIRKEAEESSKKIEQLKKDLEAATKGGDTYTADLIKGNLRGEEKRLRQLTQAQNELIKGMRVLDQAVKQFNDGSLQEMNAAFQKSAYNAAKLAQSKMQTGTKEWREMGAIMQETEQNYTRMQRDTDQLIEHLKNGGTVFRKTLEDEKKGLQDLLQVLPYMGVEYRKAEDQLKFLTKTTDDMLIKERQLKGEIVTTDDARRESLKLTQEGAEAARQQGEAAEKEIGWRTKVAEVLDHQRQSQEQLAKQSAQEVADNIERLQEYEDVIEGAGIAIKEVQDKIKGKQDKADRLESDADIAYRQYLDLQKKRDEATKNDTQATKENTEANKENAESIKQVGEAVKQVNAQEPIKPKVDTSEIERLKAELQAIATEKDSISDTRAVLEERMETLIGKHSRKGNSISWKNYDSGIFSEDQLRVYVDQLNAAYKKIGPQKEMESFSEYYERLGKAAFPDLKDNVTQFRDWEHLIRSICSQVTDLSGQLKAMPNLSGAGMNKRFDGFELKEGYLTARKEANRLRSEDNDLLQRSIDLGQQEVSINAKIEEAKKKSTQATKSETEAIKDKEADTQKLIQLQKELDEAMAKAGYKGKDAESIDLQESLKRSAKTGYAQWMPNSQTWKHRIDQNSSMDEWVHSLANARGFEDNFKPLAKETVKNSLSSYLGDGKSLADLKQLQEEWKKVVSGFADQQANDKGYKEAIEYIERLINKTVQLKEVEEKRNAVKSQKSVVDGIRQETEATEKETAAEDKSTESKKKKTKATKDDTKATKENAEASKEEAEQVDEVAEAKKKWETADKKARRARNEANKAIEEGNKTIEENNALIDDTKNKQAQLEKQQEKSVATNKRNQDMLAKTTEMQQQNGEAMQQAELKKIQAQGLTMKQLETIIALYKKQHDEELEANTDAWREKGAEIERLTKILNEWKGAPVLQMMTDRMQDVGSLSKSALEETRKFWEAMAQGADKGSEKLATAEAHIKALVEEEQKRNLTAMKASSDRLSGNLGLMSQGDIRQAIEDAKKYQLTLGSTSEEAKKLAQAIVNAEEHLKRYGVEAERTARKQEEADKKAERAARDKEEVEAKAQQDQLRMMRERIVFEKQRQSLSADALAETKKYWEAVARGANEGSWAQKNALTMMERITAEEERRAKKKNVEKADRLNGTRYLTLSESELRESIEAARELQKTLSPTESLYKSLSKQIAIAEEHIKKYGVEAQRVAVREAQESREAKQAFEDAVAGKFDKASMEELDAVIKKIKEYQATIKDPTGDGAQAFNDAKVQIDALSGRLNTLKGVAEKVTGTFASADEVMTRWAEHMNAGKTASDSMAQTLDDKLNAATSVYDANIKETAEEVDRYETQIKEATEELAKMEQELAKLEQKHANSSWFRKHTDAYRREAWRIEDLRDEIGKPETLDDGTPYMSGKKGDIEWLKQGKQSAQEWLDHYKQQKAEELGLNDQEVASEEKKADAKRLTNEQMQEGIKLLEEEYAKTDHTTEEGIKKREQLREAIDQMNQELKESTGEWMKLADAEKLAEQAGKDTFLNKEGKGFIASPEEIQKATQALERRRDALIKNMKTSGEATKEQERELADLTKKIKDLKFEQDNLNMSQEKMQMLMRTPTNAVSLDELRSAIKRADAELKRMEGSLGQNNAQYKAFAEQVRNAKNMLKEMEGQAKASATAWEKAWSRLKTYVVMYMGFNAVWQKMVGTADDLMELSDKMGEVRKTTGFTADEVGRLSDELKKLDTRTTITGLLDLSVAAGQLGLKTQEDVEGFTIAANKLMVALPEMGKEGATEMLKVALATGEIDKIRKQMEQGLIDGSSATAVAMEKVGSTIDRLRATSAATAPAITDFVKRVGAVGAQSGISIDQVAALGSTVDALGMRVEMSATALSRMIPAIKNNAFDVAKAIGVTPTYLRGLFDEAGGGMKAMLAIFQHIKDQGMGEDDIEKMLGMGSMKEIMKELNQQGARAGIVFSGLSQNVDTLRAHLNTAKTAYEENIAITQEYEKMNETTAAKWERLKNEVEEWFVGDGMQSFLGDVIDGIREIIDLISGPLSGVAKGAVAGFATFKFGIGSALETAISSIKDFATSEESIGDKMSNLWDKIKEGNVWDMVASATIAAGVALYDYWDSLMEVERETARFSQELVEEQMKVNDLTKAIGDSRKGMDEANKEVERAQKALDEMKKSTDAQKDSAEKLTKAETDLMEAEEKKNDAIAEHKKLIEQFNTQYSKYLGFMLSEIASDIELANARQLVNDKLRETITLKRKEAALTRIEEKMGEDRDTAYSELSEFVLRKATVKDEKGREVQSPTQAAKVLGAVSRAAQQDYKDEKEYENAVKKIFQDFGIKNYDVLLKRAKDYYGEVKDIRDQTNLVEQQFAAEESENRKQSQKSLQRQYDSAIKNYDNLQKKYEKATGKAKQKAAADLLKQQDSINEMVENSGNFYEKSDEQEMKDFANFKKNSEKRVKGMQDSREALLKEAGAAYTSRKTVNGETITTLKPTNPWGGNAPAESTDYATWDVNELVARRNQMDKFKNVLKPDTDIRAVLAEDKALMKALDNGLKEDWKSVLGWYNTERKKIQEELKSERFSTNEGHWRDEKQGRSRKNHFRESDYALAELDRYYSKRKEELEKARIEENMSEELFNRQAELLEQEHLERRSKLRETFTAGNTKAEKEMVKQFRDWWSKLEKEGKLDEVPWATVESEWAKALASEIGRNNLKAQQDLTQMQQITVKHLNKIADIIAKERPYDGIVDNLRKNLTEMDILFADMEKKGATDPATLVKEQNTRLQFLLGEAETAYQSSIDEVLKRMADAGMTAWAEEISKSDAMKNALMAQLQTAYDEIQNAIKKEASQIKKQTDIWWNDLMPGQDTSRKGGFEKILSRLGLQEDQVKRANALIGAGAASERVADKLAIKQMQIRLQMQQVYYQKMRQMWDDRIRSLREQGKEIDAQHAEISKQLSLSEEQKKLDEQRVAIANQLEESQNRLYTELKEWGDLLASSVREVMEASHAGDREYYNERAKLDLTGKGGPGAGTYIIIDNEGTEDATAHYEYLDERQALERQREIENENAQAEAWKKVMDDINMKMSDMITDMLNASLQNAATDANTDATLQNTQAIIGLTGAMAGMSGGSVDMGIGEDGVPESIRRPEESSEDGTTYKAPWQMTDDDIARGQENMNTMWQSYAESGTAAMQQMGDVLAEQPAGVTPPWAMTEEQMSSGIEKMQTPWAIYAETSTNATQQILNNQQKVQQGEQQTDKKIASSASSAFSKMSAACNMYGLAYQTVTNDNLDASQKFQMFALQAAGQTAISMLTTDLFMQQGKAKVELPGILGKAASQLGPIAGPVAFAAMTALLGGLMGLAVSQVAKSKSQISQVTGASASAGRLATGMLTYAEGNVNEFSDPKSLTPGRSYNVDAADGRTYRARYMGTNPKTHLTNGPEFHLSGERGREMIIDAGTTRQITMNDNEIWRTIKTLSGGGRITGTRRGRGVRAFAEGNVEEFEMSDGGGMMADSGFSSEMAASLQSSLDRNSEVLERALREGFRGVFDVYGKGGLIDSYDTGKKTVKRHGERY